MTRRGEHHRAAAPEEQDTLQHWGATRELHAAVTTVLGWDQVAKRSVAASVPTLQAVGGANAPILEAYDWVGADAIEGSADAQARAEQISQAIEARNKTFEARSTVRSLRPGRWFELSGSTFEQLKDLDLQGVGAWMPPPGRMAAPTVECSLQCPTRRTPTAGTTSRRCGIA